jgi:hypothetical protein
LHALRQRGIVSWLVTCHWWLDGWRRRPAKPLTPSSEGAAFNCGNRCIHLDNRCFSIIVRGRLDRSPFAPVVQGANGCGYHLACLAFGPPQGVV